MKPYITLPTDILIAIIIALVCFGVSNCSYRRSPNNYSTIDAVQRSENAININTASAKELETLPYVGEILAQRIVEFREKNGRFRRPEHLLLVPGISEKRFREIRSLIRTE